MAPLVVQSKLRHGHQRVVLTDTTFVQHVFVLDQDDRLLVRMSGDIFPPEKMNQLVDTLEVPVTDFPDVVVRKPPGHVPQLRPPLSDEPGYGESRGVTIYYIVVAVLMVVTMTALTVLALITTDW